MEEGGGADGDDRYHGWWGWQGGAEEQANMTTTEQNPENKKGLKQKNEKTEHCAFDLGLSTELTQHDSHAFLQTVYKPYKPYTNRHINRAPRLRNLYKPYKPYT